KALHPITVDMVEGEGARSSTKGKAVSEVATGPTKLNRVQVINFTEDLADLLDAGINLEQALRVLHERQKNPLIKAVSGILRDEIREGVRFSLALKKASPSFDTLYCNLVAAGEASGSLGEILQRLAISLKQMHSLQRRVTGAMIYPTVLLLGCVVLLFVFSTVLMPKLSQLISKTGGELPAITQVLINFSDFMVDWWWMIILVTTALFFAFRVYIGSTQGRVWWDRVKMVIPVFGGVISGRFFAQYCHTMANLLSNGVPLLNALKLVARGSSNVFMKDLLEGAVLDVGEGGSLAKALGKSDFFPLALIDRVAVGEQTGELGKAFVKSARKYDEELDVRIERLTSFVPMVVLIVMSVIVGVVAYSIMTTIFGSVSGISRRG
ncbi:MAG: type II secretion system F family protein, partial [Verrucomicrobia bacterium]|nr:type II secretion system F family protein [Verrucomicrobiota bacterium]